MGRQQWMRLDRLNQDFRYALANLLRTPRFTIIAVLSLLLGIGALTTIFTLINSVFLKPLPVKQPDRLVLLSQQNAQGESTGLNVAMVGQLIQRRVLFADIVGRSGDRPVAVEYNGILTPGSVYSVTSNFYESLGLRPHIGRLLSPSDDVPPGSQLPPLAVLGYLYWQEHFRSDPSVVGKTVRLDGVPFTVIGVTPKEYYGLVVGMTQQITILVGTLEQGIGEPDPRLNPAATPFNELIARLAPGVTLQSSQAEISAESSALLEASIPPKEKNPARYLQQRLQIDPGATGSMGPLQKLFQRPLRILFVVVGLLVLMTWINLANMLLARAVARERDFNIRAALGARGLALVRPVLLETVLLSVTGAVAGLVMAGPASHTLAERAWVGISTVDLNLSLDVRLWAFVIAITALTGAVICLLAARYASRRHPSDVLHGRRTVARGQLRVMRVLLIAQCSLSLILLSTSGLFTQSLTKLRNKEVGYRKEEVLSAFNVPQPGRTSITDWSAYSNELETNLAALPGIRAAGLMNGVLVDAPIRVPVSFSPSSSFHEANLSIVSPGFFQALGLAVREGRSFEKRDDKLSTPSAVISASLANRLFPDRTSIGRVITVGGEATRKTVTIVGVVSDALLYDLHTNQRNDVYLPLAQQADPSWAAIGLVVRTFGQPAAFLPEIQTLVQSMGRQYVFVAQTVEQRIDRFLVVERMFALIGTCLSAIALVLVVIGMTGLTSYNVSQRTSEIGVRVALGATSGSVLRMFLRDTLTLLAIGLLIGLFGTLISGRVIAAFLPDIPARDPISLAIAAIILASVAIGSTYIPARRAASLSPTLALRRE
jgi:predicted permease